MRFGKLRSIAHNLADSVGSGIGLLVGYFETDVFGEAQRSPEGYLAIDFLTGSFEGCTPSPSLARAIKLYCDALEGLCTSQGITRSAFRQLIVRFSSDASGPRYLVTVEDDRGRRAVDEYSGLPARRLKVADTR